jgi:hypothetical protein
MDNAGKGTNVALPQTISLPSGLSIPDPTDRMLRFCREEYPYYDGLPSGDPDRIEPLDVLATVAVNGFYNANAATLRRVHRGLAADRYGTQAMRMHAPPGGVQMPQLALQQTCSGGQTVGPHIATQMPEQSAPPAPGSHVSRGSSTQVNPGGQGTPARPPQRCGADRRCCLRF